MLFTYYTCLVFVCSRFKFDAWSFLVDFCFVFYYVKGVFLRTRYRLQSTMSSVNLNGGSSLNWNKIAFKTWNYMVKSYRKQWCFPYFTNIYLNIEVTSLLYIQAFFLISFVYWTVLYCVTAAHLQRTPTSGALLPSGLSSWLPQAQSSVSQQKLRLQSLQLERERLKLRQQEIIRQVTFWKQTKDLFCLLKARGRNICKLSTYFKWN